MACYHFHCVLSLSFIQSLPRDLGDKQSLVIKLFLGGAFLVALVLLIWGPLLVISLVNQTSSPNPPIYATVDLHLEGYQVILQLPLASHTMSHRL